MTNLTKTLIKEEMLTRLATMPYSFGTKELNLANISRGNVGYNEWY
ncbi:MAG: hypothetical protein HY730_06805 [Candidatus Tectomicrobia bacterium]|uniref:Uncharacterized protein n=1 Tax=Tectimicrobiota bacterium TaxID=2528274 RepID=A0A933LR80_UNCTE|nr:hypothetical protein [Candidatus Tectomicrobia bacterium]